MSSKFSKNVLTWCAVSNFRIGLVSGTENVRRKQRLSIPMWERASLALESTIPKWNKEHLKYISMYYMRWNFKFSLITMLMENY